MDKNRIVAGLDVHKDSIYLCIMGQDETIIFQKTYGVLTPDLRQMCTFNDVSNGYFKSRKVTHGNKYLRQILIEIAWAVSRTRNCFFSNFSYTQTVVKKKNKMKIQVSIARKILVAVWNMLTKEEDFIIVFRVSLSQAERYLLIRSEDRIC